MRALVLFAVLVLAGCDSFTGHFDAKEWPCGSPQWHACAAPANGMCCPENTDCGGTIEFPGCPVGRCCANGGAQ